MKYFLLGLILLCSCTSKVKVSGIPEKASAEIGPDFEKAAKFCDDRYGKKSDESEDCFEDYRGYFDLKISLDLEGLEEFCEKVYVDQQEVNTCVEDLLGILNNAIPEV